MSEHSAEKDAACIFCRNNDMASECWHSPEYEPVARALAAAFQSTPEPTDEQVGWYVDEAEDIAADLRSLLGKDTPLTARQLDFLPTSPSLAAVLINERIVATFEGSDDGSGEVSARLVADFGTRVTPPGSGRES